MPNKKPMVQGTVVSQQPSRVWKVFARWREDDYELAGWCIENHRYVVGYGSVDVTKCATRAKIRAALQSGGEANVSAATNSLDRFCRQMRPGDVLLLADSENQTVHVGRVAGGVSALFEKASAGCPWRHRRIVKWERKVRAADLNRIARVKVRVGGVATVSPVTEGANRILKWVGAGAPALKRSGHGGAKIPDREWGLAAEERAKKWLKAKHGDAPVDRTKDATGWDFECGGYLYEVKGRHSKDAAIRLSANEHAAGSKHGLRYVLLVFTAATLRALRGAEPEMIADPTKMLHWTERNVVEYRTEDV